MQKKAAAPNKRNKEVVFKNCAAFTDCTSEINNTQIDNAKDIDVVMEMYNLIEYRENYSQISRRLWLYYGDQPALDINVAILLIFLLMMISVFHLHIKNVIGRTGDDGTKYTEIWVPLKYLSHFYRILEMPLINCGVNFTLN